MLHGIASRVDCEVGRSADPAMRILQTVTYRRNRSKSLLSEEVNRDGQRAAVPPRGRLLVVRSPSRPALDRPFNALRPLYGAAGHGRRSTPLFHSASAFSDAHATSALVYVVPATTTAWLRRSDLGEDHDPPHTVQDLKPPQIGSLQVRRGSCRTHCVPLAHSTSSTHERPMTTRIDQPRETSSDLRE